MRNSQSAPILYRQYSSFEDSSSHDGEDDDVGRDMQHPQHHPQHADLSYPHPMNHTNDDDLQMRSCGSGDMLLERDDFDTSTTIPSVSSADEADVESQSATQSSNTSTLLTEDITSSDSESGVRRGYRHTYRHGRSSHVYVAGGGHARYSHPYGSSHRLSKNDLPSMGNMSGLSNTSHDHSTMRRNPCSSSTISSIGTESKIKKPVVPPTVRKFRKREKSGGFLSGDCLLNTIKAISAFWLISAISLILYHTYLYSPTYPYASSSSLVNARNAHIPLPPPEHKVSVVLMNYSRPRMIRESTLVPTLLHHPNVEEVVILHSNRKTAFKFVHPKVVNIDAIQENEKMGLSLRFFFCQLAKNDWVIHVDDDMEFTEKSLNEMLSEFAKNTKRIVGRFGRDRKENNSFNGYNPRNTHKDTEVVLTKFMVMERDICSAFFEYSHLIWEDVVLNNGVGPLWNGEDIFMSLVANHVYGNGRHNNYAMDWLDVRDAPNQLKDDTNVKLDISGGFEGIQIWRFSWWRALLNRNRHYTYRGSLWKKAMDRLATSGPFQPEL